MLPSPFLLSSKQRQKRSLAQDVIPFLHNLIFQYTNPLSFETKLHSIHTILLIREQYDSYLSYFRYKTLDVFITYMDKLIEHNENLDPPLYLPSHLESLKEKHEYFEVSDLETKIQRHNNPHP